MKILIDINHPAHVHYFRNFISEMKSNGHEFVITNRDSPIIINLLDQFNISHKTRNKRPKKNKLIFSLYYLFNFIFSLIKISWKEKPDMYLGFGSFPCTFTAFLFRKPVVLVDDTEHNKLNHRLNKPFRPIILTPFYYTKNLGEKQIFFKAYVEQFYLHSNYFKLDNSIYQDLGIKENENYALFRYITYDARHDSKVKHVDESFKEDLVELLAKEMKVFVSHEDENVEGLFKKHLVKIPPSKIHSVIANASIFISEGATMASEAGVLGTPYIYINPLQEMGYIMEQVRTMKKVAYQTTDQNDIVTEIIKKSKDTPVEKAKHTAHLESNTINPTKFLVWFVDNFPNSFETMKKNPDYQYKFK